jgi:hypothetical protein
LATDGFVDPYFLCEDQLHQYDSWNKLRRILTEDFDLDGERIMNWLDFHVRGYHDDRTLVVLADW